MPNWLVSRRPHADENKEERKTVRNAENGKIGNAENAENAENAQCGREKMKKENTKKKYEDAERETVRSANVDNRHMPADDKKRSADVDNRQPECAKIVDPAP